MNKKYLNMKIAIYHREGSFSDRWIAYCKKYNIEYLLINVLESHIIEQIKNERFTHFMWHINHMNSVDLMIYPYIFNSLESFGVKCFPNFYTRWHFDDKIAQKYLLEGIEAPLVPSYVFYSRKDALFYLKEETFPIVAKLKRGAGATNVKLLNSLEEAKKYVDLMFSVGINSNSGALENLDQKFRVAKQIKNPFLLIKKTYQFLLKNRNENKVRDSEKGYFYYQKYMPNNSYDTRIIIINNKAVAIRRNNRNNDFRASGSGKVEYDHLLFDIKMIQIAFDVVKKISSQSLAFDFVYDEEHQPKIVEICFAFSMKAYDRCDGYWDIKLNYHPEKINLQEEMIKSFLNL